MLDIYLNIYDIHRANNVLDIFGLGAYHTAIQINDLEISFSLSKGIYYVKLENIQKQKDSVYISSIDMKEIDIYLFIDQFSNEFNKRSYNYLNNNCNHFTNKILFSLFKRQNPNYINRLACIGSCLSCLLPHNALINSQEHNVNEYNEINIKDLIKNGPLFF